MRLPNDPTKYSNRWKYLELGAWRYSKKRGRESLLRDMVYSKLPTGEDHAEPKVFELSEIEAYRKKYHNSGIYSSIFQYDNRDLDKATRLGSLYFDFDSSDGEEARGDTLTTAKFFFDMLPDEAIRIYFSGKKGFHLEIEALALGITGSRELPDVFRYIANHLSSLLSLTTLDFVCYDVRRMWRLPNSKHQSTGLFKRLIRLEDLSKPIEDIQKIAQTPSEYEVPEQIFNMKGNEWYREFTYKYEESKIPQKYTSEDLLDRFNQHGTTMLRGVGDTEKVFDPIDLFDNCSAIHSLWKKAETKHELTHYERLFLCSILTYTDEAIYYLHEILKNCHDYQFEISQAHIDDWVRRRERDIGGRPFSCEKANQLGVGCGTCNLEPRKKWVKIGDSWIESEEESKPSPIRFAYKRKN